MEKSLIIKIQAAHESGKIPAFSYERVSTDEQAEHGLSLDAQSKNAQRYAEQNGLIIVHRFSVSESAYHEGRKEFNKMLTLAVDLGVRDLIFKNMDRLNRNDVDWPVIKKLSRAGKIRTHFYELGVTYDDKSTPENEVFLNIASSFGKFWSDKISWAVKKTYQEKAAAGIAPMVRGMYGYKYDKTTKQYFKDPDTRDHVEMIFSLWDSGDYGQVELMNHLNSMGIENQAGRRWCKTTINRILTSPFYAGKFYYKEVLYDGNHEPYITWIAFQKRIERMEAMKRKTISQNFLLSGILRGPSGLVLTGSRQRGAHESGEYVYYMSSRRGNFNIAEAQVFDMIDNAVAALEFSDDYELYLIDFFSQQIQERDTEQRNQATTLSNRIGKLKNENKKLLELILTGIDPETVRARMDENRKLITSLENQVVQKEIDVHKFTMDATLAIQYCHQFPRIYARANHSERAQLLREMILKIDISKDRAELHFKPPFTFVFSAASQVTASSIMGPERDFAVTAMSVSAHALVDWLAA